MNYDCVTKKLSKYWKIGAGFCKTCKSLSKNHYKTCKKWLQIHYKTCIKRVEVSYGTLKK